MLSRFLLLATTLVTSSTAALAQAPAAGPQQHASFENLSADLMANRATAAEVRLSSGHKVVIGGKEYRKASATLPQGNVYLTSAACDFYSPGQAQTPNQFVMVDGFGSKLGESSATMQAIRVQWNKILGPFIQQQFARPFFISNSSGAREITLYIPKEATSNANKQTCSVSLVVYNKGWASQSTLSNSLSSPIVIQGREHVDPDGPYFRFQLGSGRFLLKNLFCETKQQILPPSRYSDSLSALYSQTTGQVLYSGPMFPNSGTIYENFPPVVTNPGDSEIWSAFNSVPAYGLSKCSLVVQKLNK